MMRSLYSGVSGIKVHQTRMDVIGNNIANINTIGFKSSRTTFSDMFSQMQSSASAPTENLGGINARQIGLGVNVESIDLNFTDSSPQQTGKNTDLALSGNGLFVLKNGNQSYYTRNGAFSFDESGYLVLPGSGFRVQGWNATSNGIINSNGTPTDVIVPVGKTMEATATTQIDYSGNLNKESLLIEKISYVKATGVTDEQVFDTVATGTAANPQSINVDGENVIAATITMKDGTTMNVTSGYYEVGRSVPITTLATVYDSLGGKHEVTVLIDKDATTADDEANISAQETSKATGRFYIDNNNTDDNTNDDIEYRVTENTDPIYTYDDADGNPVYVTEDKVSKGFEDTSVTPSKIYAATKATGNFYKDTAGNYYSESEVNTTVTPPVLNSDGTTEVELTDDTVYQYNDGTGTKYVKDTDLTDYTVVNGENTKVTEAPADDVAYKYTDSDGEVHYLKESDTTTRPVYDNRWRVYLAPAVGKHGPASDDFINEIDITEVDGSTMKASMNNGSEVSFLYFDDRGQFVTNGRSQDAQITFSYGNGNGASDNTGVLTFEGLTQYANSTTSFPITNGNPAGILQSLAVDGNGVVTGTYTNGLVQQEAQIAVAQFSNASGLTKVGTTIYSESNNSGAANIKTIADFGLSVISSALEMSNVDLATEFSDMIVTQRGFQANSKITTVSDEMLETLVNMKR